MEYQASQEYLDFKKRRNKQEHRDIRARHTATDVDGNVYRVSVIVCVIVEYNIPRNLDNLPNVTTERCHRQMTQSKKANNA